MSQMEQSHSKLIRVDGMFFSVPRRIASLLAAAPALLEALKAALYTIRAIDEDYNEQESYIEGQKVLAKAEGRG